MHDYSVYEDIVCTVEGRLLTVMFNRPERRNAMSARMGREFRDIVAKLYTDGDVGAVILSGAGDRGFCAGLDIKEADSRAAGESGARSAMHDYAGPKELMETLINLPQPVVCALNGDAAGMGASIALCCDIIVANETARFSDPHIKNLAVVAGDGGTIHWPLMMSIYKAKEFLLTGDFLLAKDAAATGMINYALPYEEMMPKAREIAQKLADGPQWAVRWTKVALNRIVKSRMELTMDLAAALEMITLASDDHREAMSAFVEKRPPKFTGH
ncbi:MAG: enoyl-CoA hydratase/isomerase family protein [Dehalococcoidia bacterium]